MIWIAPSKETASAAETSIYVEKIGRLRPLTLVHGLEDEIKHGGNINSYYNPQDGCSP